MEAADVIMIIGANPTDAHPVFASQMKRRLRQGAKLIIVDPRRIDLVKSPHVHADYHLPLLPGTNVAIINALAHVVVTEGLVDEAYVKERCDLAAFEQWRNFVAEERNSPEATGASHRSSCRGRSRGRASVRYRRQRSDLLRPGRHRTQPGLDDGDGHGQSRYGHRQLRQDGRRHQSRCADKTTCRAPATWDLSRTNSRAIATFRKPRCANRSKKHGTSLSSPNPGCAFLI